MVPRPKHYPVASPDRSQTSQVSVSSRDEEDLLHTAERYFLRRSYKEALKVSNRYLKYKRGKGENVQYLQTVVVLSHPFRPIPCKGNTSTYRHLEIRLGANLTITDQLAAIALQSWHELASISDTKSWRHLLPTLEIYDTRPMPLEFFQVWMEFWQQHGRGSDALLWNLQIMRHHYPPNPPRPVMDELLVECLTKQLPCLKDAEVGRKLATELLQGSSTFSSPEDYTEADLIGRSYAGKLLMKTAAAILDVVEERETETTLPQHLVVLEESKHRLKTLIEDGSILRIEDTSEPYFEPPPIQRQQQMHFPGFDAPPRKLGTWLQTTIRSKIYSYIHWVREHQTYMQERPELQRQVLASVVFTFLAWSQRRRTSRVIRWFLAGLLSPVTELLEALRHNSPSNKSARIQR